MQDKELAAALDRSKVVFAVGIAALKRPENTIVFNSDMPLAGTAVECDVRLCGSHYACVSLDDPRANQLVNANNKAEASIVLLVSKQEAVDLMMIGDAGAVKYADFSLERQFEVLSAQHRLMKQIPYREAVSLLEIVRDL